MRGGPDEVPACHYGQRKKLTALAVLSALTF